ncbi:hypothetical protein Lser_V15G09098 [Lactuca serriola]
MILRGLLIIVVLIVLPRQSYALSPLYSFRHLYEQSNVSPSPSPSNGVGLASGGSNFQQSCNRASRSCQLKNIAACLTYSQSGPDEEIWLYVQNNDKNPLHVKIMILASNNTIDEIDLPIHQMNKIKISRDIFYSNVAIALNTSVGDCVIHVAAPPPETNYQKYPSSYSIYITPINGAYFVILIFIIGGTLTFVKSRIHSSRHNDGVPYHELEMENSKALSSLDMEENGTGNWDEDWDDDDWGDKKPVKSGGQNPMKVEQLNTKLPNSNGRRKEWDD